MTEVEETVTLTRIFCLRTTIGQEQNVARLIEARARTKDINLKAILIPDQLKGYIFVEATHPQLVDEVIGGISHIRGRITGTVNISELEPHLVPKSIIETLRMGMTVEIISGPFKGSKARITAIQSGRQEVTVELLDSGMPIPIVTHADHVKPTGIQPEVDEEQEEREDQPFASFRGKEKR
ncbi:MAG: transcription elongation factor Spt5 [Candidatus Hodarchaeota archaeon]